MGWIYLIWLIVTSLFGALLHNLLEHWLHAPSALFCLKLKIASHKVMSKRNIALSFRTRWWYQILCSCCTKGDAPLNSGCAAKTNMEATNFGYTLYVFSQIFTRFQMNFMTRQKFQFISGPRTVEAEPQAASPVSGDFCVAAPGDKQKVWKPPWWHNAGQKTWRPGELSCGDGTCAS